MSNNVFKKIEPSTRCSEFLEEYWMHKVDRKTVNWHLYNTCNKRYGEVLYALTTGHFDKKTQPIIASNMKKRVSYFLRKDSITCRKIKYILNKFPFDEYHFGLLWIAFGFRLCVNSRKVYISSNRDDSLIWKLIDCYQNDLKIVSYLPNHNAYNMKLAYLDRLKILFKHVYKYEPQVSINGWKSWGTKFKAVVDDIINWKPVTITDALIAGLVFRLKTVKIHNHYGKYLKVFSRNLELLEIPSKVVNTLNKVFNSSNPHARQ